MPYSSVKEVPDNVPDGKKKQFMEVFNSVYSESKDEGKAMASAYSAIKKSEDSYEVLKAAYSVDIFTTPEEARARSMDMGFGGAIFVTDYEEQAVYMPGPDEDAYMNYYRAVAGLPLEAPEDEGGPMDAVPEESPSEARIEALRAIVAEVMKEEFQKADYQGQTVTLNKPRRIKGGNKKFEVFVMSGGKVKRVTFGDPNMEIRRDDPKARANFRARHSCDTAKDKTSARYWSCRMWQANTSVGDMTKNTEQDHPYGLEGKILKADDEQRMVYGWASVVTEKGEPVIDRQGDVISPETMVKAVNKFMEHVRVGKAMHTGEQVGVVVHSFPITKELGDSLGIHSDREGWIVAYKVYDDAVWEMVKSGKLAAFSIGGRATKEDYDA
jgi:hypothetical protein